MIDKNRYRTIVFILLGILVFFVYGYHFYLPREPYFDEILYVNFMRSLGAGEYSITLSAHPPLWNFLMAGCVRVFGDYSWSWRLVSLLAGVGVLIVLYFLVKQITQDVTTSLLAVFFMLFDCLSLTQARAAMMNAFLLLWMLLSMLFFFYALEGKASFNRKYLLLSGIFLGLALATKILVFNMVFFFGPFVLIYAWQRKAERGKFLMWSAVCFILIPVVMFFCVYVPVMFFKDHQAVDIWAIPLFHLQYHFSTKQTHPYVSDWWTWPAMARPVWMYFQTAYYGTPGATVEGIVCIGNPALFWMMPVAIGYMLWEGLKNKSRVAGIILAGFASQWLCYIFVSRMKFLHYMYPVMPFLAMAFAVMGVKLWNKGKIGRAVVIYYLVLTAGMFVFWYPLLTGLPVSASFYSHHIWFRSWV
ncbi:MAG: phospholipid carrier-dependent glycosyltransferase [Candidatus Omnitrophica bacterium]|nr:phospholipid carrier-dependent glycosyltransferase [Candidatus Omnitrophota bacterium]